MARLPFPLWTDYSYKMRWNCERCEKQMDIVAGAGLLFCYGQQALWSVKACPADHPGRFSVFALPLIVTPPNLQNHLTLASEGYLNNQCFGSSSRNVAVGGEVREKHNQEMSVCNGDSTSGRCRRT